MAADPEITVVIPTRDRWRLVLEALDSALEQNEVSLEVVVVDDGSTDETPEKLASVGDPRLRVKRHAESQGVARARNAGISEARGTWVAFLDDDDFWAPRKLRAQLDAAAGADADFVYAAAVRVNESKEPLEVLSPPDPARLRDLLPAANPMPAGCSNLMVKTQMLRDVGGFDEELSHLADWDLWLRLAYAGHAAASPDVLVAYVEHQGSMQLMDTDGVRREGKRLLSKHRELRSEAGVRFDGLELSRWIGWSHERAGRRFRAAGEHLRAGIVHRSATDLRYGLRALVREATVAPAPADLQADDVDWLVKFR